MWHLMYFLIILTVSGDGQVDFNEFMTILGPKLLSSETREGFLGNTIDTIFWQVNHLFAQLISSSLAGGIQAVGTCDRAVKTTQHLFPERSCEWWRCCVTVTDVSPYTRKADRGISGVGRGWEQTSGPWDGRDWLPDGTMNVPTVVAARMGMMADRADVKEGTGRWALIETVSEPVLFTHHQLDQRLLLGAEACGLRCEEGNLVQGNKSMNTLWVVLTIFTGASFLNMLHSSSIKWGVILVQFALLLAAGTNVPCGICEMVNGWKWS